MKNVRILAMHKFSKKGSEAALHCPGFFYAPNDTAALYPCTLVVMATVSPSLDLCSRKGSAALLTASQTKSC